MNLVPSVSSRLSSDGRMLWSVYETVLKGAVVAPGVDFAEGEKGALQKAKDMLNSSKWGTYKKFQAAYWAAEERYRNAQLSAENTSDPKLQEALASQLEQLESQKNQALAMWASRGYKAGIETALATVEQISGRNPQLVWQQWKQSFSQAVKTDLRANAFYETYLWPANFLDTDSPAQWTELRMDAGEIQALSAMASDSTQQLATTPTTDPAQALTLDVDVSNVSLELARVEVMRPWIEPLLFENRAWRWPDDREPLSDGEDPPSGSLPAYVTAVVFARNLEIQLQESPEQIEGQFHTVPLILLGPLALTSVSAAPGAAAVLNSATLAPISLSQVSSAMVGTAAADPESAARLGPVAPEEARPAIDPTSMVDLLAASAETPPPQQVGTAASEEPQGAQIIAFVCRKLPRSPNPDPKLDWKSKPHGGKRGRG